MFTPGIWLPLLHSAGSLVCVESGLAWKTSYRKEWYLGRWDNVGYEKKASTLQAMQLFAGLEHPRESGVVIVRGLHIKLAGGLHVEIARGPQVAIAR